MNNRWSDAARTAALAVRQARTLAARPVKGNDKGKPKKALSAPKPSPMVYAGGSATFDERTGKRIVPRSAKLERVPRVPTTVGNIPEKEVWIPPPDSPHWQDPKFVESFKRGIAERKKAATAGAKTVPPPNIFYSSSYPQGPGQEDVKSIFRYDPKNPVDASKGGYGLPKKKTTPVPKPRVIVGGKRYTRVGGRLYPDVR
jgi:hypothetical protein